jgi:hypothetical protein
MKQIVFLALALPFFVAGCSKSSGDSLPLVTPTVYYKPIIDKAKDKCEPADLRDMPEENGKILMTLCKRHYDNCLLQGSCFVTDGDKTRKIQYTNKKDGVIHWAEKIEDRCPYGYGVRNICLDPFYSVAADLTIHKPGDVIFVPRLVGVKLPDGSFHNGYLIIRDEGGRIVGENRFDFFTGFFGPYDPENSFYRAGFSDINHRYGYQKANEDLAKKVRAYRNYPNIPQ